MAARHGSNLQLQTLEIIVQLSSVCNCEITSMTCSHFVKISDFHLHVVHV